jgi:hydroxymethylpyrimidine pyrophosphatase-like HAD family hydrolase
MFSDKYSGRVKFLKNTPTIKEILEKTGIDGTVITLSGRVVRDEEEKIKNADFEFLIVDEGFKPWNAAVVFEDGKWKSDKTDIEKELGKMEEEKKIADATKWKEDTEIFDSINSEKRIKKFLKRSKYMRMATIDFTLFDEEKERPVWRFSISNTPHVWAIQKKEGVDDEKMENQFVVDIIADALTGRMIGCREQL